MSLSTGNKVYGKPNMHLRSWRDLWIDMNVGKVKKIGVRVMRGED